MFISKLSKLGFSYAVAAGMSCAAHGASTYDVVRDFNIKANPNGVWSYQNSSNNLAYSARRFQGIPGLENWSDDANSPDTVTIVRNKTGGPVSLFDQEMTLPPNCLALESSNDSAIGDANIVFHAPAAGTYTIKGNFLGLDVKEAHYTHINIFKNSDDYLLGTYAKANRKVRFDLIVALAAGDTITFQVESSGSVKARHDVGLSAKITGP
jgi:hypothetical protein